MSEVAQSRDIQDPETAKAFADIVQSPQRLALLMILTACDIRGRRAGRLDGLEGLAAARPLLRHRAAAVGRPFAGAPAQPRRRGQEQFAPAALGLAGGRRRRLSRPPLRPLLAACRARAAARARPHDPRRRPGRPQLRRRHPGADLRIDHGGIVLHPRPPAPAVADRRRLHHVRRLHHRRAGVFHARRAGARHLPAAPRLHLRRGREGARRPHHRDDAAAAFRQAADPHRSRQGKPAQPAPQAVLAARPRCSFPTR